MATKKDKFQRVVAFVFGLLECALLAGCQFGWAALVFILKNDGVYSHLCPLDLSANVTAVNTTGSGWPTSRYPTCAEQDEQMNLAFTLATTIFGLSIFVIGWFFDFFGLRITRLVGWALYVPGCLLLGFTSVDLPAILYPGIILFSVGGYVLLLTNMQIGNYFDHFQLTVVTIYNAAFDSSSATFFFFKLLHGEGVNKLYCFIFLASLCTLLIFISTFFLLPRFKILPKMYVDGDLEIYILDSEIFAGIDDEPPRSRKHSKRRVTLTDDDDVFTEGTVPHKPRRRKSGRGSVDQPKEALEMRERKDEKRKISKLSVDQPIKEVAEDEGKKDEDAAGGETVEVKREREAAESMGKDPSDTKPSQSETPVAEEAEKKQTQQKEQKRLPSVAISEDPEISIVGPSGDEPSQAADTRAADDDEEPAVPPRHRRQSRRRSIVSVRRRPSRAVSLRSELGKPRPIRDYILTRFFLIHLVWHGLLQLRFYFYIGFLNVWLQIVTQDDSSKVSYYTNASSIILMFAIIIGPMEGWVLYLEKNRMDRRDKNYFDHIRPAAFLQFLASTLGFILSLLVLLPEQGDLLFIQFVAATGCRTFLYGLHHAYIVMAFPPEHFGRLSGLVMTVNSIIGALQYALFIWAEGPPRSPQTVNILLLILTLITYLQPLQLWFGDTIKRCQNPP